MITKYSLCVFLNTVLSNDFLEIVMSEQMFTPLDFQAALSFFSFWFGVFQHPEGYMHMQCKSQMNINNSNKNTF